MDQDQDKSEETEVLLSHFSHVRPHRWQPTRLPHPWDSPGKNTGVGCHFLLQCMKVKSESEVAQSCLTPSDPMDCSLPGSSIHGIFQARGLEWVAIAFSQTEVHRMQNWRRHHSPDWASIGSAECLLSLYSSHLPYPNLRPMIFFLYFWCKLLPTSINTHADAVTLYATDAHPGDTPGLRCCRLASASLEALTHTWVG